MFLRQQLAFAAVGWLSGILGLLVVSLVIFPAVLGGAPPLNTPGSGMLLTLAVLICTPAALIGGLVGGRLPREGGRGAQLITAAIFGLLLTIPASCISLWYLGW